jgi:hypothetical protein
MDEVEREPIEVMFIRTNDDVAEFGPAFQRLEELVGTRGRKFFGAFYPQEKQYRACVRLQEGDDPSALGLEAGTLPAGATCGNASAASRPRCTSASGPHSRR